MRYFLVPILAIIFFITLSQGADTITIPKYSAPTLKLWSVQSIDTMKYSRDLAREKNNDLLFDSVIDTQMSNIAQTGATHVAIDTPYDDEFLPYLKRWVSAARRYHLSVWFRGNWSGWEGWFNYPKISESTHIVKTKAFILSHPELFLNGDIFTACPECENGGPGDPRSTNGVQFRKFLLTLDTTVKQAFKTINRTVTTNYYSMNRDVASFIMDGPTVTSLAGPIVIDHYVSDPTQLAKDSRLLAQNGTTIVLGEFGAPIPDINGTMNGQQQAEWISKALDAIARVGAVTGLNYWVNVGGSTALWADNNQPSVAVSIFDQFYSPTSTYGVVIDQTGKPLGHVTVKTAYRTTETDDRGYFQLPIITTKNPSLVISAAGYDTQVVRLATHPGQVNVLLTKTNQSLSAKLYRWLKQIFGIAQ